MTAAFRISTFISTRRATRCFATGASAKIPTTGVPSHRVVMHTAGEPNTLSYRVGFTDKETGAVISPWHDISLRDPSTPASTINFVVEIPRYQTAKLEMSTKTIGNPIIQDVKGGRPRHYHGPIYWNYGAAPQTWEDPKVAHPIAKEFGDNDPLDVVEIGSETLSVGDVVPVKVLGALAMIDSGELDWKVLAVRTTDPLANQLNDVADIDKLLPGTISGIREWFRWYKTPDGKGLNRFAFEERALTQAEALEVVEETHHFWNTFHQNNPTGTV